MNHKNYYYYLILCLAVIALTIFFVIKPLSININDNKTALHNKRIELANQESRYEVLKKMGGENTKTKEMSDKISALWPENKEVSSFVVSLEDLAKGEGLTFSNVSISEPKAQVKPKAGAKKKVLPSMVQFSFDTTGTYDQMLEIIKNMEKFERFNTVTLISLANKGEGVVNLQLTGNIFYGK